MQQPSWRHRRLKNRGEKTPKKEYTDSIGHKVKVVAGKAAGHVFVWKTKREAKKMEKTEKKQVMQGWLTYVSLAVGGLAVIFQLFGATFPEEEANAFVNWLQGNGPEIVQGLSLIGAFFGRLRREWRAKDEAKLIEEKVKAELKNEA